MASVVGSGSAAATSVTIPAHQVGDLILISARGTAAAPSVPAASGTVPAWVTLQSALANSIGLTTVGFIATATNHTSGTFTNATHMCVIVLRPASGKLLTIAAARSSTGNGNNTQTIVYPALTFSVLDGTSMGVRIGTRGVAVTAVGTAPSGWTNQVVQPAGASALMSLHTRTAIAANPTADSVSTSGTNSAYRAHTVEVQEIALGQSVSVGGVSSAQSFGAVGQVQQSLGIPPPTWDLHVSGEYLAGQALVGWTGGDQFGDPTVSIVTGQNVSASGLASAQSLGTVTPRAVITIAVGGVSSAQSFGAVAIKTTAGVPSLGVPSAQAFGGITPIPGAVSRSLSGIPTAQAFGSVTPLATTTRQVTGIGSAQAFGALTLKPVVTREVTGIGSAQAFGGISIDTAGSVAVVGIPTAQSFGTPSLLSGGSAAQVTGIPSGQSFGAVTTQSVYRILVSGLTSAQSFGLISTRVVRLVGGVSSAQAFGSVQALPGVVVRTVFGLGSAASFGTVTINQASRVFPVGLGTASAVGVPVLRSNQSVSISGVPTAQAFSTTTKFNQTIRVNGIQPTFVQHLAGQYLAGQARVGWQPGFGPPLGQVTIWAQISRAVSGISSAAAFGIVKTFYTVRPASVASAQQFGAVTFRTGATSRLVLGIGTAQAFGKPFVFNTYLKPTPPLSGLLVPTDEESLVLTASTTGSLALTPSAPQSVTLVPTDEEELLLVPTTVMS